MYNASLNIEYISQQIQIQDNMNLDQSDYEDYFKVIVVGDSGTGKTNMIQTYDKGTKPHHTTPTLGVEYCSKVIKIDNSHRTKMQIWDTAGQEQYRSVTMSHYKNAFGALVVFDLTSRNSFNNLSRWIADVRDRANEGVAIGIIGNKMDLSDRRAVSRDEAEGFAAREHAFYAETSVNNLDSLRAAFERLGQEAYKTNKNKRLDISRANIELGTKNKNSESDCKC